MLADSISKEWWLTPFPQNPYCPDLRRYNTSQRDPNARYLTVINCFYMGKLSKKLIVYLDQNFISEMAKAEINQKVNPLFSSIYELLHKGFVEEKIVVPSSFFHDLETSFAPHLKERINQYQAYLGQIDMENEYNVLTFQAGRAARKFLGEESELVDYRIAYHQDPDAKAEMFKVDVDLHPERWHSLADRVRTTDALEKVKENVRNNNLTVNDQYKLELDATRTSFLESRKHSINWLFVNKQKKIEDFVASNDFSEIPIFDISSRMWGKIFVDNINRPIGTGDQTDVEIISTALPYVDVFAGDTFMVNLIRQLGLDKKYNTVVFGASKQELAKLESFIKEYLENNKPVNRPVLSVFVVPDKKIREFDKCFDFFKDLGLQWVGKDRWGQYVENYVFDDGKMPRYWDRNIKMEIPFTGLQDITHIKIKENTSMQEIVKTCKENCRSDNFILIDRYQKFDESFLSHLLDLVDQGKSKAFGYRIFSINEI